MAKDRYVDDTMLCLFIKLNYEKRFYVVVMFIMVRAGGVAASFSLLVVVAAWLRALCPVSAVSSTTYHTNTKQYIEVII